MIPEKNISDAELEVMKVLWREGRPLKFKFIQEELSKKMKWEKSTIATLLRRLQDKKAVHAAEKTRRNYMPSVSKDEYARAEEQIMIDNFYEGSAKNLVASFCENGRLTEADIDELKKYFKSLG